MIFLLCSKARNKIIFVVKAFEVFDIMLGLKIKITKSFITHINCLQAKNGKTASLLTSSCSDWWTPEEFSLLLG